MCGATHRRLDGIAVEEGEGDTRRTCRDIQVTAQSEEGPGEPQRRENPDGLRCDDLSIDS